MCCNILIGKLENKGYKKFSSKHDNWEEQVNRSRHAGREVRQVGFGDGVGGEKHSGIAIVEWAAVLLQVAYPRAGLGGV